MEKAILRTLCYHDLFDYPLALSEISQFLIGNSKLKTQNAKVRLRRRFLRNIQLKTQNLIEEGKIEEKKGLYFLKGRGKTIAIRKKREKYSQKKLLIAERAARFLRFIPTIKMVALTGALAVKNSKKDDDIDFLIVTSKNRLWLTRIQAVLLIELLGMRRKPNDLDVADKICLNIFLDENSLSLPKSKRNLFTAHEIAQTKVLWQKDDVYQNFLTQNQWVKEFLLNWKK